MDNNIIDIGTLNLCLALLLLFIPAYSLYYFRTGLVRDTFVAAGRMVAQLFFIGFYLEYLFEWNSVWINILWVVIMVGVASYTVLKRTKLPQKRLFPAVCVAFFFSIVILDVYFLGVVVRLEHLFDARYFIPISGMILGNMLSTNVMALNTFYSGVERERQLYHYLLGNGATLSEALAPFMREALIKSFNPALASMSVMGLIALPGTMTGQILGGSSPNVAIKYQITIMVTIFASTLISVLLTLWVSRKQSFNEFGIKNF
ncbi:MAG: ABC transporter permease [Bacteroidaceae bacterium]|nr:ABC transporter permease [Bacteroidaceae bacterium]